jgi:hypothetical protein
MGLKIAQAVLFILGSSLIAYNIVAFKVEKHGSYYFLDNNQLWLAIGVALFALAMVIRRWDRL